jgi:tetratricopeptide (TPR) repeat protein
MADPLSNKGWALLAVGRLDDAKKCFEDVIELLRHDFGFWHPAVAEAFIGLGEVRLAKGDPAGAIQHLEAASGIWEKYPGQEFLQAINQFALARALWDGGGDRRRARALAESARRIYASIRWSEKARACSEWLSAHRR